MRFPVGSLVYYVYDDGRTYLCRVDDEPYHDFGNEDYPLRYPLRVLEAWRMIFFTDPRSTWRRNHDDPLIGEVRNIKDDPKYDWILRPVPVVEQLAALAEGPDV